MPTKYIIAPTQGESPKNTPAKSAITGSFAPQGINGVSIAVALRSLSFLMVLQAITPGIEQPVPITKGIIDLPDKPTFLNIGSKTTDARAIYPQSSSNAIKKYITITSGKKPITAITPPRTPSTSIDAQIPSSPDSFASAFATKPCPASNQPTKVSAIHGPNHACEMPKTKNITTAKIGRPNQRFVKTSSILSWKLVSFVNTLRSSTSLTILFTNSKRFLSAVSTIDLSLKSISP